MSLSRGFPFVFNTINQTNTCLKAHDNELTKLYTDINAFLAANGHAHTGSGTDGAQISYDDLLDKPTAQDIGNTPAGNLIATNIQSAINELDDEKLGKGIFTDSYIESRFTSRPVMKSITGDFAPSQTITATTDYHVIDLIGKTSASNLGSNITSIYTHESQAANEGTATLARAVAYYSLVRNNSTGTINSAIAHRINFQNTSSGQIVNAYGVYVDNFTNTPGAVANFNTFHGVYINPITAVANNIYGIYINNITGGANRNIGIYDLAPTNYFSGSIRIENNNLVFGALTQAVGAGATNTIGIKKGTNPGAQVGDMVQIFGYELPNTKTTLGMMLHETVAVESGLTPDRTLTIMINGQKFKIPLVFVA